MSGSSLYEVKCYVPNTNTRKTHGKVALSTPRVWGVTPGVWVYLPHRGVTLGVTPNPEGLLDSGQLQSQGVSNTMVTPKPEELPGGHIEGAHSVPTVLAS